MIIDTSALIAVMLDEPERGAFEEFIAASAQPQLSAPSYLEAGVVVDARRDPKRSRILDSFLAAAETTIAPVTAEQAIVARQAYRVFGRGSGHPANLNLGDCFAYALAKVNDEALLFKGDDFNRTDIRLARA
jgi:ribonuclease VapC